MESFGNERQVQQGEDWNLDLLLSASSEEYIPYIISNQRKNPYFVVTIASTKYEKNARYVKSFWNSVDNPSGNTPAIPRFYQTVPEFYGYIDSIDELPTAPVNNGTNATYEEYLDNSHRLLYQYCLNSDEIDEEVGHKPYYYFYFEYNNGVATRIDYYDCTLRFNFPSSVTAEWGGQNYMYQITLVSGDTMASKLNAIYILKGKPEDWPSTTEAQYNYVKVRWPEEFQPDIDADSPLGTIETPEPILVPTKLEVFNNLRKLI